MDPREIADSVAYCGLVCALCRPESECRCRSNNHCNKRLAPGGCFQYDCCTMKGLSGCWECSDAPCGKDMHAPDKVKIRAFIRCIREDGLERFSEYIARNAERGVVYHLDGIFGDYDLKSEEEVLRLLREEQKPQDH
ncbi:MAG: DUF3795 domain-containing protein [Clostridiales bacterium]|nr:DUF3795 domain-containing protein [Clostridiales bacterium]